MILRCRENSVRKPKIGINLPGSLLRKFVNRRMSMFATRNSKIGTIADTFSSNNNLLFVLNNERLQFCGRKFYSLLHLLIKQVNAGMYNYFYNLFVGLHN